MKIDLTPDMVTEIVRDDLMYLLDTFDDDIERVVQSGVSANVYSQNPQEEIEYLVKKKIAIQEVLDLYIVE